MGILQPRKEISVARAFVDKQPKYINIMKKLFTLFAGLLLAIGVYAQEGIDSYWCWRGYVDGQDIYVDSDATRFIRGISSITVNTDAYLFVTRQVIGSPAEQYMAISYVDLPHTHATMKKTGMEKLHIPAGTWTLYLYDNGDGTIELSYEMLTGKPLMDGNIIDPKQGNIWPILIDDITYQKYMASVVADFIPDDQNNFLWIWSSGDTYEAVSATGLNFYGNNGGYLSLVVTNMGWSGAGFCVTSNESPTSLQAAEAMRQSFIQNPEDYFLHLAIKSTDNASHDFSLFRGANVPEVKFTIGTKHVEGDNNGPIYTDFPRDGQWYEYFIPMSDFANILNSSGPLTSESINIFCMMSGGLTGTQLNLDGVYFCDKTFKEAHSTPTTPTPTSSMLTVSSSNEAQGLAYGSGSYSFNSDVQIFAIPKTGYYFTGWSDNNTDNPRIVTLTEEEVNLTAGFDAEATSSEYAIDVKAENPERGEALAEEYVRIEAIPASGCTFVCWSDGETTNPRFIKLDKDIHLRAIFSGEPDGTENVPQNVPSRLHKIMVGDKLLILRGGKTYSMQGQEVR